MAQVRVPRKGVTQAELATVLSRRLGAGYQVEPNGDGEVTVRRSQLSAAVVRIRPVPGATVFRVRGGGLPVYRLGTTRRVADALRRSPEFRTVLPCRPRCLIPHLAGCRPTIALSFAAPNIALHSPQSRPEQP